MTLIIRYDRVLCYFLYYLSSKTMHFFISVLFRIVWEISPWDHAYWYLRGNHEKHADFDGHFEVNICHIEFHTTARIRTAFCYKFLSNGHVFCFFNILFFVFVYFVCLLLFCLLVCVFVYHFTKKKLKTSKVFFLLNSGMSFLKNIRCHSHSRKTFLLDAINII